MKLYTRRDFLKFTSFAAIGSILDIHLGDPKDAAFHMSVHEGYPLGRILYDGATSRRYPESEAEPVSSYVRNDVISISEPIIIHTGKTQRETWHQLEDGSFVKSQDFQPVGHKLNTPRSEVPSSGQLAEITVPFTTAWSRKKLNTKPNSIFYFGSLHWIVGLGKGTDDRIYYLVREDRWGDDYYIDAQHMRVIDAQELSPISPEIDPGDKKIQISIRDQLVIAFEKDQPVFTTSMASGLLTEKKDYSTPAGSFKIDYKRPSRHMLHSDRLGIDGNELFGVPWVTYFTNTGIAFHGTYWHNDFTKPRSHGCINLPIPAARWIYLWTLPTVPPREKTYVSRHGTPVMVY